MAEARGPGGGEGGRGGRLFPVKMLRTLGMTAQAPRFMGNLPPSVDRFPPCAALPRAGAAGAPAESEGGARQAGGARARAVEPAPATMAGRSSHEVVDSVVDLKPHHFVVVSVGVEKRNCKY